MICLSIGVTGADRVKEALSKAQMAEIRLDLSNLTQTETISLFGSPKNLIATCRPYTLPLLECRERLLWAIEGSCKVTGVGKRYIDLDYNLPELYLKELIEAAKQAGFNIILSYHNLESTEGFDQLCDIYATALQRGAQMVKIVTTVKNIEECTTLMKLYKKFPPSTLLAFALNREGRFTRLLSKMVGAPFMYCSLKEEDKTATGQYSITQAKKLLSPRGYPLLASKKSVVELAMAPASKSHAQRDILSAAFAKGESRLTGYTPCADSEAALSLIASMGVKVSRVDHTLQIESPGFDEWAKGLSKNVTLDVGESGLLCRLMIPLAGQLIAKNGNIDSITITGKGSLKKRKLFSNQKALNEMGLRVESSDGKLPVVVRGAMVGAHVHSSGKDGSQLLSGMLMALPLCPKSSFIEHSEPTSIPYIDLTIKTLHKFGITIQHEDYQKFRIPGQQRYQPKSHLHIEGDWSSASLLLVAGAISKGITVTNLPINSSQADEKILDILRQCGVSIDVVHTSDCNQREPIEMSTEAKIVIHKPTEPLRPFETDATHFPDLFPALVVLAMNCQGTSRIKGVHRLANKESHRAESLFSEFTKLGANMEIENDTMVIQGGELHGGFCLSHNDHRIAMALVTASLTIQGNVYVINLGCISKSFPDFINNFK